MHSSLVIFSRIQQYSAVSADIDDEPLYGLKMEPARMGPEPATMGISMGTW